jgi:DNA polymerase III alpha subunit (gram-positive type)
MSETRQFLIALSPIAQELVKRTKSYELEVNKVTIEDNTQRANAVELGKKLNGLKKDLDNERLNQTRPIEAAADEIRDCYKPITGMCETMVKTLKDSILKFDQEERRKADEAARIAQLKAEEEARKERERLAKLAEKQIDSGKVEKAEETISKMENVAPVVVPIYTPPIQKQKGESTREYWKFEVIDDKLIPRKYLMVDTKKIQGVVSSLKGETEIPGVRVYSEKSMSFRR